MTQHNTHALEEAGMGIEPIQEDVLVHDVPHGLMIAQGFEIDSARSEEHNEALLLLVTSYVGVIPRSIDSYIGEVVMKGAVIAPIQDVQEDAETGEVVTRRWNACLFKLVDVDDRTKEHIILNGGGRQGMLFAQSMMNIYGPGDWPAPARVRIQQEARTGKNGQPRRMYRFQYLGRP